MPFVNAHQLTPLTFDDNTMLHDVRLFFLTGGLAIGGSLGMGFEIRASCALESFRCLFMVNYLPF